jgi:hypothetical protein
MCSLKHPLYPSVEAMLAVDTLRELTGAPIQSITCRQISSKVARSGSQLFLVETEGAGGLRLVLKKVSLARDWLMRTTEDHHGRSVQLWLRGILDQLPPEIEHGVLACSRDGDGWALLMHDLGETFLTYTPFQIADENLYLDAMAALHSRFLEAPELTNLNIGLCKLSDNYLIHAPQTGRREAPGGDEIPRRVLEGWEMVSENIAPDVAQVLLDLVADSRPLCEALRRYPQTLIHGDWRHANQGHLRSDPPKVVLIDWQLAGVAPPSVELARYLGNNSVLLPRSKEATIEFYHQRLAARLGPRFDLAWWEPQLALGLLGGFVQDSWSMVLKSTHWYVGEGARDHWKADLVWWTEQTRNALKWL